MTSRIESLSILLSMGTPWRVMSPTRPAGREGKVGGVNRDILKTSTFIEAEPCSPLHWKKLHPLLLPLILETLLCHLHSCVSKAESVTFMKKYVYKNKYHTVQYTIINFGLNKEVSGASTYSLVLFVMQEMSMF